MRNVALFFLLSIAMSSTAAAADDKDKPRFAPGPAASYVGHQTLDKVTIAAVPFLADEQTTAAFGKLNPNKYGVLPVLVILQNETGKTIRLDLQAEFVDAQNHHAEAMPAEDVQRLGAVTKRPRIGSTNPLPLPLPSRVKKGPLNVWEIEGRAFAAKLLPVGETAYGFFYFQVEHQPGSRLYLTGLRDAASGKDLFYFEVPLEKQ